MNGIEPSGATVRASSGYGRFGFTLIELTVVLVIGSLALAFAANGFARYLATSSARRAAQMFQRDLLLARNAARTREEAVVIRFYEGSRSYRVETGSGRELVRRSFGSGDEIGLSGIDLAIAGDTLRFDRWGRGDLPPSGDGLGGATFTAGPAVFEVRFNALGASRIAEL